MFHHLADVVEYSKIKWLNKYEIEIPVVGFRYFLFHFKQKQILYIIYNPIWKQLRPRPAAVKVMVVKGAKR